MARYPPPTCRMGRTCSSQRTHFATRIWEIDETSQVLRAMRAIEELIIVGVYSNERREEEYTKPGYEAYALNCGRACAS